MLHPKYSRAQSQLPPSSLHCQQNHLCQNILAKPKGQAIKGIDIVIHDTSLTMVKIY
jgi:hypothetical protein